MYSIRQMTTPNQRERLCRNTNVMWKPDIIAIHMLQGYYESGIGWLKNIISQASAHFVVSKKGEITQLVDLGNMAWHAGAYVNPTARIVKERMPTQPNAYTVGIELEGFLKDAQGAIPDAQMQALIWLIKHIKDELKIRFNINIPFDREHIIGHYEICKNWKPNCPGPKFQWNDLINNLNYVAPAPVPIMPIPLTRTYIVQKGDSLSKIAQKMYGNGNLYLKIYNANKGVIGTNMNNISVGMKLTIPN